jgi:outer membrane protein assembly factor BamB
VALGALLTGWLALHRLRPGIERVSRVDPDGKLTIEGRNFGRRQGRGRVEIEAGERSLTLRKTSAWTGRRIVVHVPEIETGGTVRVVRRLGWLRFTSPPVPFVVQRADLPSEPHGYQVPVEPGSPWPTFRRDHRNTGRSDIAAKYQGDQPWAFCTGKGVFSTPVIDAEGTVYVGSADHIFYAIAPGGSERWRFETGEIIDSAAALPRDGTVLVPSGDGRLYKLRTDDGTPVWTFDARVAPRSSYNNWFEGNVSIGYDGTIYAGNTNFNYYAITPDGRLKWTYETGSNNWSVAALAEDGTLFWTSNDTRIRAVRPDGTEKWSRRTWGFLAASVAIGSDGTLYVGSFDSNLYVLDPETGRVKWTFKTRDHVYASAALGVDAAGQTDAIYFGSTDGRFYALSPEGDLLWSYDTGAPIRSSAALGRAPEGEDGWIVYFGCGNGRLYALNAADGTRRWSYDTTPDDPELQDRNDLNGSPALGESGVTIGGEHGRIWYVPYDYPLQVEDARGATDPGEDLPADVVGLFPVTPGGRLVLDDPPPVPAATVITLRLVVRQAGETVDARLCRPPFGCSKDALEIDVEPAFPFRWEPSADGRTLHIFPQGFLEPDTVYTIRVRGAYFTGGIHFGNLALGGRRRGKLDDTIVLRTAPVVTAEIPLSVAEDRVTALEWTRLAVPIPTMLPSLNQIGFDYIDWIVGTVAITPPDALNRGRVILWAIGGRRNEEGVLVPDLESDFTLSLSGSYQSDAFILSSRSFEMAVTGIPIPFNQFQIRGQLGADLRVRPGATAFSDTEVLSVPTFGPYLALAGLANRGWQKLLALGTYVTRPYPVEGRANERPTGIAVASVDFQAPTRRRDGAVVATFQREPGASFLLAEHRAAVLLVDATHTEAVPIDYHANLCVAADDEGHLSAVTLTIPAGTELPSSLEAIVILDVFPIHRELLVPTRNH